MDITTDLQHSTTALILFSFFISYLPLPLSFISINLFIISTTPPTTQLMKTLAGVSKRWNKNIFQLLARDKVYKKISVCLSLAIQESTNTVAIFSLLYVKTSDAFHNR